MQCFINLKVTKERYLLLTTEEPEIYNHVQSIVKICKFKFCPPFRRRLFLSISYLNSESCIFLIIFSEVKFFYYLI